MERIQKKTFLHSDVNTIVTNLLVPLCIRGAVLAFEGPLGVGKTTLIKEILRQLGVTETVTSPTFIYCKKYTGASQIALYHFDLYRLTMSTEFMQAGFDEYFHEELACIFIEWPRVIRDLLVKEYIAHRVWWINLRYCDGEEDRRIIEIAPLKKNA